MIFEILNPKKARCQSKSEVINGEKTHKENLYHNNPFAIIYKILTLEPSISISFLPQRIYFLEKVWEDLISMINEWWVI